MPLVPEVPLEPDVPLTPDEPDVPLTPDEPELPLFPEEPDVPLEPDEPEVPELPSVPDVPEVTETATTPKERLPAPSVLSAIPDVPSEVGHLKSKSLEPSNTIPTDAVTPLFIISLSPCILEFCVKPTLRCAIIKSHYFLC